MRTEVAKFASDDLGSDRRAVKNSPEWRFMRPRII